MLKLTHRASGRHFLQIPGPTNVPERVLRAIDNPTIDHRGPEFQIIGKKVLSDIKKVFQTDGPVVICGASGTGAWEAALVNTLSAGDKVLMYETGHFATVLMPEGHDADKFRKIVLDNFDMSLGVGLAKLAGKVFRIGHLSDLNELMLMGTLAGVEMGLALAGVPYRPGGVAAAMDYLTSKT